jgi:ribosomal protein S12 methylthiotransferase accessory factor
LFDELVSPYGLVSGLVAMPPLRGLPEASMQMAVLFRETTSSRGESEMRGGTGRSLDDPERARTIAIAEAAERYSGSSVNIDQYIWATVDELPGRAIDLSRVPRCSAAEMARPECIVGPLDPTARMRWAPGTDLLTGEPIFVPAAMCTYGIRDLAPGERFWYKISTGYAVHTDPVQAVLGGLLEVIERDAIALTWLAQLPLPLLEPIELTEVSRRLLTWLERHHVTTHMFDATTELGVPIVYCVQTSPHSESARSLVGCSIGLTIEQAAEKALFELVGFRPSLESGPSEPVLDGRWSVSDGARYMAVASRAEAFSFLLDDHPERPARGPIRLTFPDDGVEALDVLLDMAREHDLTVVAVDRTTDELRAVGLLAVCVVIPELQPMTLNPATQYRAHPRLRTGPVAMGYPERRDDELNPWPQPFA